MESPDTGLQEFLLLQHYLIPLQPDVVLVAVYPENDIRNNSRTLEGDPSRPYFRISSAGQLDPNPDDSFLTDVSWLAANTQYEQIKAAVINHSRILQVAKEAKRWRTAESIQALSRRRNTCGCRQSGPIRLRAIRRPRTSAGVDVD